MKKILLLIVGLLPLLLLAPGAKAQNYTYDCLCLYSDPRGTCREYTCDAFRSRRPAYYNYNNDSRRCGSRYDYSCGNSYSSTYRPRYWNTSGQYYDSRYNEDWYSRRYTTRPSYYNYPAYSNYDYNYPYYY